MAHRLLDAVGRAFTRSDRRHPDAPHFHQGAQGNVATCFVHGCTRPKLS